MYLDKIISDTKELVEYRKSKLCLSDLLKQIDEKKETIKQRNFTEIISKKDRINIIGELKKASPSLGIIRNNFDIVDLSKQFLQAGIVAISVLTEPKYFKGDILYLNIVHNSVNLPVLRKDFIIDEYQIYESFLNKSDAILLISRILSKQQLKEFLYISKKLNMAVVLEVHDENDLEKALDTDTNIIGINNRNLDNFTVDINNSVKLRKLIPENKIVISESGIRTKQDILTLLKNNINTFLIGEILMKTDNIKMKIKELTGR